VIICGNPQGAILQIHSIIPTKRLFSSNKTSPRVTRQHKTGCSAVSHVCAGPYVRDYTSHPAWCTKIPDTPRRRTPPCLSLPPATEPHPGLILRGTVGHSVALLITTSHSRQVSTLPVRRFSDRLVTFRTSKVSIQTS